MPHKVFWLEPAAMIERDLRRYKRSGEKGCPLPWGYHNKSAVIGREVKAVPVDRYESSDSEPKDFEGDYRWPTHCDCGYAFQPDDEWQVNDERLYSGHPSGELYTLRTAPIGAMWDAWWMGPDCWRGPDGIALVVKTPGGDWMVDGEASNCTRSQYAPIDTGRRWTGRTHYCWIRHGDPRTGNVHVDKSGDTCAAGAGSILIGGYHGFLRDGYLTDA